MSDRDQEQRTGQASDSDKLPMYGLPTLQRNALRKVFERPEFTPEDVVRLGYRKIQQAEGIGQKGLTTIVAWLKTHGLELDKPLELDRLARPAAAGSDDRNQRSVEMALRVLRTHGYVAYRRPVGRTEGEIAPE